jgi:hypothetical protein
MDAERARTQRKLRPCYQCCRLAEERLTLAYEAIWPLIVRRRKDSDGTSPDRRVEPAAIQLVARRA